MSLEELKEKHVNLAGGKSNHGGPCMKMQALSFSLTGTLKVFKLWSYVSRHVFLKGYFGDRVKNG